MHASDWNIASDFVASDYAYVVDAQDYHVPALLYALQKEELVPMVSFKPFSVQTAQGVRSFSYGSLVLPVSLQKKSADEVARILSAAAKRLNIQTHAATTGLSASGVDLGSRYMMPVKMPKAAMLIGEGVSAGEAGEVWHLLDQRVGMPITKLPLRRFGGASLK